MLLEIKQFSLWLSGHNEHNQILDDLSISLAEGETVALVGESGSGKSITALSILRLLEDITDIQQQGSIHFAGQNLQKLDKNEIRSIRGNRISMIFQEPMSSLNPVFTIGNQMLEPLRLHQKLNKAEAEKKAIALLARTGIDASRMGCYPHQLSGGQRQRVMIAMALACKPSLLIADEPTTALDVTIQAQILELIKDIQDEYKMGVLLITHDLQVVRRYANRIYIMQEGRIVESGATEDIFNSPTNSYTQTLLSAIPHTTRPVKPPTTPIVELSDVTCQFSLPTQWVFPFKRIKKSIQAVKQVNLTIDKGTTWGIVGESGSGKTTLGLAILKLVHYKGEILFNNIQLQNLSNKKMRPLRSDIQIVFQDPFSSLSPRMTIEEIIDEGLRVHSQHLHKKERSERVAQTLLEVGLTEDLAYRFPHELSGGQRQRVAIARAIILKPQFLILDEPTSALDVTIQGQILDLLLALQEKYQMTYLFISHDLRVIRALSDHVAVMQNGQIIEAGPADEIFTSPSMAYTKTLFSASLGDTPRNFTDVPCG